MATDGPVSRWNGIAYSGDDERLLHSVLVMPSGAGRFSARSGRRPGAGIPTVSGLTVTVPADAGVIYDESLGGGPWLWALPSPKPIALDQRPGAGTSRIDLIVARIYNVAGGRRELAIEAVTGVAGASPSKPALPPLSMEIAAVTVPASGNLEVVSNPARTVAAGGILPVATSSAMEALPIPHVGLHVYVEAEDATYKRTPAGAWTHIAATSADQGWTDLMPATGWQRNTGAIRPRVRRSGSDVWFTGGLFGGSANSTACTVPSWAAPSADLGTVRPVGHNGSGFVVARVWPNGAFQPSGNTAGETLLHWTVA